MVAWRAEKRLDMIVENAAVFPVMLVTVVDPSVEDPVVKKLPAVTVPVTVLDPAEREPAV